MGPKPLGSRAACRPMASLTFSSRKAAPIARRRSHVPRSLSPEEADLWARVTATIRPLSRESARDEVRPGVTAGEPKPIVATAKPRPLPIKQPPKAPPPPARPGTTLDGTWDRKLRSGSMQPDRVVDLHGHTLDDAWAAIDAALERAITAGDR